MRRNLIIIGVVGIGLAVAALKAKAATDESVDYDGYLPYDPYAPEPQNDSYITGDDMAPWKTNEYPKYAEAIRESERRHRIPTDLLARALYQESRFRADIIAGEKHSPVGAVGIAQFMPDTAREYGLIDTDGNDYRTDPFASINAAGLYLSRLYAMFNSWTDAIAAYNWGPGNVQAYNRTGVGVRGQPMPQETREYIAKITADVPIA